ncbi:MAG: ATP-binding protein [Pseudomonadota bacterium]
MKAELNTFLKEVSEAGLAAWDAAPFLHKVTGIVPGIIYVFNQKTQSNEYTNRSVGGSMGYTSREIQEMGAELMPRICHPDDLPKMGAYFETLRDMADGEVSSLEYRMRHKNGGWVWLLSYDTVFERDVDGNVLRHIGVATDITAQKEAEALALQEKRAADAANEELRAFAYSMSHDMKSPANTLHLLLNEIRESHSERLDADAAQLLDLSLQTVGRMQNLVEDVLHYTRIIGETAALETVALTEVLEDVCANLAGEIGESGSRVEIGDLPAVRGNAAHLRILFQNLIANSLKYGRDGVAPVVQVAAGKTSSDRMLSIDVTDNGIGIPVRNRERIFKMFKRLHSDVDIPGTGLGLAICRRIALGHGGHISVNSTEGQGSVFTVTLKRP